MRNFSKFTSVVMIIALIAVSFLIAPITANAEGSVQLYFKNSGGWDKVYCYIWQGSGPVKGTDPWPGAEMPKIEGSEDWYQVEYTAGTEFQVIFNDNGTPSLTQTGNLTSDLTADKEAYWFVLDGASTEEGTSDGYTAGGLQVTVLTEAPEGFATVETSDSEAAPVTDTASKELPKTGENTFPTPVILAVIGIILGIVIFSFRKK
ncbi:MAG: hypothetical protein K0R21_1047 [Anaerocolumna sp.]|jgi:LPXTG-motif cell wall-anchored protein|nr:hypothetical protein [Anaerocolumna sp.]